MYVHVYICMYMYMYMYMNIYDMYNHVCIYIHTYISHVHSSKPITKRPFLVLRRCSRPRRSFSRPNSASGGTSTVPPPSEPQPQRQAIPEGGRDSTSTQPSAEAPEGEIPEGGMDPGSARPSVPSPATEAVEGVPEGA